MESQDFTLRLSIADFQKLKEVKLRKATQECINAIIDKLEDNKYTEVVVNEFEVRKTPGMAEALEYLSSVGFILSLRGNDDDKTTVVSIP